MEWRVFPAATSFGEFSGHWQRLNNQINDSHPLLDVRFVGPLLRHFGDSNTYLAVGGPTGFPESLLLIEPSRMGLWRTFVPSQCQVAPVQLSKSGADSLADLLNALPGRAIALELLCQDPLYSVALSSAHEHPLWEVQAHATTMTIDLSTGWPFYWKKRSKNLRKNIRRLLNRIQADQISLATSAMRQPQEVALATRRYGELESTGWKGDNGTALHPANIQGSFYEEVMTEFSKNHASKVFELIHNERLVSSRLLLMNERMQVILKTTYDEDYSRYGVGWILLLNMLVRAYQDSAGQVIEFYTNATPEQLAWSTGQRTISHVTVYRSGMDRLAIELARKGRTILKSAPLAIRAFRSDKASTEGAIAAPSK